MCKVRRALSTPTIGSESLTAASLDASYAYRTYTVSVDACLECFIERTLATGV